MKLSLVDRSLVDLHGVEARVFEDAMTFGFSYIEAHSLKTPDGFKDHGLVMYNGVEYYMSTYDPPVIPD